MLMQLFPLRMRIQLALELNVLTLDFENKNFDSDQILSSLSTGDEGKQIRVKDLQ